MPGAILWQGLSELNGAPVVLIATKASRNRKTGPMVQTWILCANCSPVSARNMGADIAICGNCKHRLEHTCYVNLGQAPWAIWQNYNRGGYLVEPMGEYLNGKSVRVGSYGDPAAVPISVWRSLLEAAPWHTGYTHAWRRFAEFRGLLMASVDSEGEA